MHKAITCMLPIFALAFGENAQGTKPTLILHCNGSVSTDYDDKEKPARTDKGEWAFWIEKQSERSRLDLSPNIYPRVLLAASSDSRFFALE